MLSGTEIPMRAAGVIVRTEPQGMLLFQGQTDQMYFTSPAGYALFSLCDGTRTVGEIEEIVCARDAGPWTVQARTSLGQFLEDLAERRLIELWGDER
jgi:hypothetical protein